MNKLQPYEQTVASKMQDIDIPDMRDIIWLRINDLLDSDIITPEAERKIMPRSKKINKWYFLSGAVIVAIVGYFFYSAGISKSTKNVIPVERPSIEQKTDTTYREDIRADKLYQEKIDNRINDKKYIPLSEKKEDSENAFYDSAIIRSNTTESIIPQIQTKRPYLKEAIILKKPDYKNLIIKPKAKGITGIDDKGYRLIPQKKDSIQ